MNRKSQFAQAQAVAKNNFRTCYQLSDIEYQPIDPGWSVRAVLPARFFRKIRVDQLTGCWLWLGSRWGHPRYKHHAYGQIRVGELRISAHVFAYRIVKGEIPEGCEIDHTCENKLCVNPAHLEAVTHAENIRRIARRKAAIQ